MLLKRLQAGNPSLTLQATTTTNATLRCGPSTSARVLTVIPR